MEESLNSSFYPDEIPVIEFLKDKVYLGAFDNAPADTESVIHFTVDDCLVYNSFHHDFGPFHIGHLYRFAVTLHEILGEKDNHNRAVLFYSRCDSRSRANAAAILCCYMVLIQSWPPHLALAPISQAEPPFMPFRDAGYSIADFVLTIQDIVYGLWRAKEKQLFDIKKFNLEEYETYEQVHMGDFNVIPPNFVAFASPQYNNNNNNGKLPFAFRSVAEFFKANNVKMVFRLNSKLYDKKEFEKRGINHIDMIFEDGTCPPLDMVKQFIGVCQGVIKDKGLIAVHCKAGLGRTGCLIGAHLIYSYGFTANEAIAYMRFMRPGMVVGPQQHWLYLHQNQFREWKYTMGLSNIPHDELCGYSPLVSMKEIQRQQQQPKTPPSKGTRGALIDIHNNNNSTDALPAPTPGQPRKGKGHIYQSDDDDDDDKQQELEIPKVRRGISTAQGSPIIIKTTSVRRAVTVAACSLSNVENRPPPGQENLLSSSPPSALKQNRRAVSGGLRRRISAVKHENTPESKERGNGGGEGRPRKRVVTAAL